MTPTSILPLFLFSLLPGPRQSCWCFKAESTRFPYINQYSIFKLFLCMPVSFIPSCLVLICLDHFQFSMLNLSFGRSARSKASFSSTTSISGSSSTYLGAKLHDDRPPQQSESRHGQRFGRCWHDVGHLVQYIGRSNGMLEPRIHHSSALSDTFAKRVL